MNFRTTQSGTNRVASFKTLYTTYIDLSAEIRCLKKYFQSFYFQNNTASLHTSKLRRFFSYKFYAFKPYQLIYKPLSLTVNTVNFSACLTRIINVLRLRWSRGSVLAFGIQVHWFKPGRSRRIFQGEKINTPSFGREVKAFAPCRRFTACKRSLNVTWKSGIFGQNSSAISLPSSSAFHY